MLCTHHTGKKCHVYAFDEIHPFKKESKFLKKDGKVKNSNSTSVTLRKDISKFVEKVKNTSSTSATLRVGLPLKPNVTDLTSDQIMKAKMVNASKIAYENGYEEAQAYLDKEGIPYDIDTSLSSKESLVLLADDGVKIAYRGTKIQNVGDVSADAMIAAGVEEHHPQFKNAEEQFRLVTEKYGSPNELLGYSLGGNKAITVGNKYGVETTTFNPFLAQNFVKSNSDVVHNVVRTTEDFASLALGFAKGKFKVSSILPHQDKINPVEAHELSNFTETSARRPGATETLLNAVAKAGGKAGEYELLDSIKTAQEKGQTFTEFVHEFNGRTGQDTTPDGSSLAGPRMHRNSKWVKYWEESKNEGSPSFTAEEEAHFDSIESEQVYDPSIRPKERESFRNSTQEQRASKIKEAHEHLETLMEAANSHTEMHTASANALKRAVHPTNLATGIAGGVASSLALNAIDPDHKIEEHVRSGIEGAGAGVATELGMAVLAGGSVAAAPMAIAGVAGGASYLAGSETSKLTTTGLHAAGLGKDASEAIGSTIGGGVGGGVAIGSAIGGAALLGAEIGELGGPLAAAAGAGIGSVIGLGSWAIGKLFP